MQFHLQICALVALGVTGITSSASLPSIFKKCKLEDESCLKSSAEYAIANLGNGLKELGIDSIDPLHVGTTEILPKPGPMNIYQRYEDNKVGHLPKLNVKQFRVNLDKCEMSLETFHPELRLYGNYTLKGNLLGEEIDARGEGKGLVCKET
ncbi:circadian clock-controlled protein-like [Photinus pyralis]|uniref:circadian clock-controlled protein-like n=1 Tax=Photinus pyralis TaxID=7054 RepID=UPI0012672B84|nr:circadian clock-controlled protein-like [Photinus pyralis]